MFGFGSSEKKDEGNDDAYNTSIGAARKQAGQPDPAPTPARRAVA